MRRLIDGWVNHPAYDYVAVALLAALAAVVNPHNIPRSADLGVWYQTLASVTGVLLGLGGVALTVVFAVTPTRRLQQVYRATGPRLARVVLSCLGALAVATGGFVAMFLVSPTAMPLRNGLTAGLCMFAGLRFTRLWWLFRRVLAALMVRDPEQQDDPQLPWQRPVIGENDYALPERRPARSRANPNT